MTPNTAAALRALVTKWRNDSTACLNDKHGMTPSEHYHAQGEGYAFGECADELAAVLTQEGADAWRCFHCDETFTTDESAREHFGASLSQCAACQIDIAEYRCMEEKLQRYCEEDTELHREILRLNSAHAVALRQEEEKGYARGLRDARAEAPAEPRAASDEPLFTASMYGTAADADKARDAWRAAQSEPRAAEGAGTCPDCATVTDYRDGIDNSEFVPCAKHSTAAAVVTAGGVTEAMVQAGLGVVVHAKNGDTANVAALLPYAARESREEIMRRILVAAISAPPAADAGEPKIHPATRDLVERFSGALLEKLAAAEKKYGYTDGWASRWWMDECRAKLREHIEKGDPRDVAAYCAFLWHHKEPTHDTVDCECHGAFLVNDPDGIGICLSCNNTLRRRKRPDEIVPPAAQAQDAGPGQPSEAMQKNLGITGLAAKEAK